MSGPDCQPFGESWIAAYFAEVDRMDPDGLMSWYTDEGRFRFVGQPQVYGKAAIKEVLAQFYGSIAGMRHQKTGVWVDSASESGVWEAEVHFTRQDGGAVTIPAVSVLRLKNGRVDDFRFLMDPAPLYAATDA